VTCVANSSFTAQRYHDAFGINPQIIHPIIFPEKYITETSREYVTYINPHPLKGLDVAIAIAEACPGIPFLFQESWPLTSEQLKNLQNKIDHLPNVIFNRSISDIRLVYKRTKILLAPSKWEESYGRVACEVHFSGIPVVSSNIGGLPESVGSGGILLEPSADISEWVNVVKELWSNNQFYQENVSAAFDEAKKLQNDPERKVDAWVEILEKQINTKPANIKHTGTMR
jgi:glycosyltransferase involved in cell wall biosynthesis